MASGTERPSDRAIRAAIAMQARSAAGKPKRSADGAGRRSHHTPAVARIPAAM
jgi:hypothetical protein